jgi:SAM-dependent methyltransferase
MPPLDRSALAFWNATAKYWHLRPPLAPSTDDIAWFERSVTAFYEKRGRQPLTALLLGLTPDVATMRWPADTALVVVDWSTEVFRHRWPERGFPQVAAPVRGDWRELPVANESIDVALGDGCYTAFATPGEAAALNGEVARVLKPRGLFCIRCYTLPRRPTSTRALFDDLLAGRYANPALFRWLVVMAVHGNSRRGVVLADVWDEWQARFPEPAAQLRLLGWDEQSIQQIARYKDRPVRYSFHALAELQALATERFTAVESEIPDIEHGECFPRLSMRRR